MYFFLQWISQKHRSLMGDAFSTNIVQIAHFNRVVFAFLYISRQSSAQNSKHQKRTKKREERKSWNRVRIQSIISDTAQSGVVEVFGIHNSSSNFEAFNPIVDRCMRAWWSGMCYGMRPRLWHFPLETVPCIRLGLDSIEITTIFPVV